MPDADHYYSSRPSSGSSERRLTVDVCGRRFAFRTDAGTFSHRFLDRGTRLLLATLPLPLQGDVLDWGAGWGAIGTVVGAISPNARVVMVEVNTRAAALAEVNAGTNGAANARVIAGDGLDMPLDLRFDFVITNPPIRAGKRVVAALLRDTRERLYEGGEFWMVVRTSDGARSYRTLLEGLYPRVEQAAMRGGYRVFRACASP